MIEVYAPGTSQDCSDCGEKVLKDLSVRVHSCPSCGLVMDRDENSARNILQRANRAGSAQINGSGDATRRPRKSKSSTQHQDTTYTEAERKLFKALDLEWLLDGRDASEAMREALTRVQYANIKGTAVNALQVAVNLLACGFPPRGSADFDRLIEFEINISKDAQKPT